MTSFSSNCSDSSFFSCVFFRLQFFEPLGFRHAHAAKLAVPQIIGGLAESMAPAQVFHRHAGFGLMQEAN